jgi:hypothetical protein
MFYPGGLFDQTYASLGEFMGTWFFMIVNDLNSSEIHKNP